MLGGVVVLLFLLCGPLFGQTTNADAQLSKLEAEMEEINRLYRIIGKCEGEINRIKNPVSADSATAAESEKDDSAVPGSAAPASTTTRSRLLNPGIGIPLLGVCLLILGFIRRGH